MTIAVLATASMGQSPQAFPGCEPVPEVREIIDKRLDPKDLDKMKFSDRVGRKRAEDEKFIAEYPREVQPITD